MHRGSWSGCRKKALCQISVDPGQLRLIGLEVGIVLVPKHAPVDHVLEVGQYATDVVLVDVRHAQKIDVQAVARKSRQCVSAKRSLDAAVR